MTTRRDFLKGTAAAAGVAFCSCGMLRSAHAQSAASPHKLPVMFAGKRVKTIDVHAHCVIPEASRLLGPPPGPPRPPVLGREEVVIAMDKRLAAMDSQAVDLEVLSINPNWYKADRELAGQVVKLQNEKLAELCASKPDRFAGFASLTLQAPDLAVTELETAIRKQGLKGAAIGGNVDGVRSPTRIPSGLGQGGRARRAPVHSSAGRSRTRQAVAGNGWLSNAIGNPAGDDDRAVAYDLRGHLRPLSQAQGDRRPRRRFPAVLRRPLRPRLPGRPRRLQSRHQAARRSRRSISSRSISTRWSSRPRRSVISRRRSARARSCSAATIRIPWQLHPVDHIFACIR